MHYFSKFIVIYVSYFVSIQNPSNSGLANYSLMGGVLMLLALLLSFIGNLYEAWQNSRQQKMKIAPDKSKEVTGTLVATNGTGKRDISI